MDKKYCPYCMSPVKEGETCKNCGLTEGVYTPRDHHLPLGTVLNNRYLVGRVLGEGGFGITYIGCDLNLEMKVAIKEYFPIDRVYRFSKTALQVSNYAHAVEKYHSGKVKFLREARTMARLDKQQNIVSVRDFFEENNTAYIVMEYVEGTTLKELVNQRGGRIPAGELLHMLEPLFSALTSIHELGLIHRDISPDNLMLENGKIKLLDFGCARESAAQSETMTIALKQGYAPIEQYQHKGQGPWTDVYALSATIYYCLTGKTPQSAVDRLSEEELIPPRKLGVDLTASQEAALLYGMNVKAKERFQSAEELYAALYTNVRFTPVSDEVNFAAHELNTTSHEQNSAPEPDLNHNVHISGNDSAIDVLPADNKTVAFDSTGELSDSNPSLFGMDQEKKKAPEEGKIKKTFNILKQKIYLMEKQRRNLMILAGSAVLLVAVVCVVCAIVLPKNAKETIASGEDGHGTGISGKDVPGEDDVSGEGTQQGNQPNSEFPDDILKELESVETLFANAVVLEKYTQEDLQKLMDDDTVPAIRIPEVEGEALTALASTGIITITKPVLVEENAYISFHDMVTLKGENAYLWIQGEVNVNSILQTVDGGRIVVDNSDFFWTDTLWLEKETDVLILNGQDLYEGYSNHGDLIIGGKNTLFQNADSVSDETSLRQAVDRAQTVVICDDITLETDLYLVAPVMIEEGVTVTMQGSGTIMIDGNDSFLWNEGQIQSAEIHIVSTYSNPRIINYGEINDTEIWMANEGTLINLGDITTGHAGSNTGNGSICNIGNLRFQSSEFRQLKCNLINYGSISVSFTQDAQFNILSGIDNYGEIRFENGFVTLNPYLCNMIDGRILICDNAVLDNFGVIEIYYGCELQCEPRGSLMNDGAVYCYNAASAYTPANGWFHLVNANPGLDVANIDELTDALQNPDVQGVNLTGEIFWNGTESLTLTKNVVIAESAGLLMAEGSELILDGCYLENSGYLKVDDLTLTHGGSLGNYETMELYNPESTIKLGNEQRERRYNGTDCLINYGSILNGCEIELYDSAIMIQKGGVLEGNVLQISDHAYFANIGEIQWGDGSSIEISGQGQFHNLLRQEWSQELTIHIAERGIFRNCCDLTIQSGEINVEQGGSFESHLTDLTLGNNLSVMNYGDFYVAEGGDSTHLQGYFENHGILRIANHTGFVIDAPFGAANPACLNNQGEVRIGYDEVVADSEGYIRSDNGEFIGNEVIYRND